MSEILKFKGCLGEKQIEARQQELRLKGLIKSLRDSLNPFEKVAEIDGELVAAEALELASLQIDYKGVLAEIAAIEKALRGV